MSNYSPLDVTFASGSGCWLTDTSGKKYFDALSGVGVVNLGHCHPKITESIIEQSQKLLHTSNWYLIEHQEELAARLCNLADMDKVFFSNSGAEANEAAIKIARLFARQKGIDLPVILTAKESFHGRTMATLSATGTSKIQTGFSPLMSEFIHFDFDDVEAIEQYSDNRNIVAVMLEPIQGEAGVIIPKKNYLNEVKAVCEENDWLLILDEVQSGMGRTGKLFAHQHNGFTPDVLCLAKGLGNGVPIGACLASGKASNLLKPGSHGSTFGGNYLSTSVGLQVLDIMRDMNLCRNAREMGDYFSKKLNERLANKKRVKEIRSKGLMIGIELDEECTDIVIMALDNGLVLNVTKDRIIRMLPPLIINRSQIDEIVDILDKII